MRGSIQKVQRKHGHKWRAQVDLPRGPEGERKRQTKVFDTKTEAESWLSEINTKINRHGYLTNGGEQPLRDYLQEWLQEYSEREHRSKTHYDYQKLVQNHINPKLGDIPLEKLTPRRLQTFVNHKRDYGRLRGDGGLSVGSVRKIFHVLSGALNRAVQMQLIRHNPARPVSLPTNEKAPGENQQTLSSEQVRNFLNICEEHSSYGPVYHMALFLGMRISEITGLQWQDVDLEGGTLDIRRALVQTGREMRFNPPKTQDGCRTIGIPDALADRLENHRNQQDERAENLGEGWEDAHDLVFPATNGAPLRHRNLRRELKQLLEEAELPQIRFHDLRHTCATLMMERKEHPKVVKELLGHASVETTLDIYSHVTTDIKKRASQALEDSIVNGGSGAEDQ